MANQPNVLTHEKFRNYWKYERKLENLDFHNCGDFFNFVRENIPDKYPEATKNLDKLFIDLYNDTEDIVYLKQRVELLFVYMDKTIDENIEEKRNEIKKSYFDALIAEKEYMDAYEFAEKYQYVGPKDIAFDAIDFLLTKHHEHKGPVQYNLAKKIYHNYGTKFEKDDSGVLQITEIENKLRLIESEKSPESFQRQALLNKKCWNKEK